MNIRLQGVYHLDPAAPRPVVKLQSIERLARDEYFAKGLFRVVNLHVEQVEKIDTGSPRMSAR